MTDSPRRSHRVFSFFRPSRTESDLERVQRLREAVGRGQRKVAETTTGRAITAFGEVPNFEAAGASGENRGCPADSAEAFNRRLWVVGLAMAMLFVGLIGRVFSLQIVEHERYADLWAQSQIRTPLPAVRGAIVDRHGETYAITRLTGKSLFAVPKLLDETRRAELAAMLAVELGLDETQLRERLAKYADKQFVWVKRHLTQREEDAMAAVVKADAALGFRDEMRRLYPQGHTLANVLGFVGADGAGLEGVELQFDSLLAGEDGYVDMLRDARGKGIARTDLPRVEPRNGATVQLTIDHLIQTIAEEELDAVIDAWKPKSATAIVMNPHTGEVLAMVTRPTFDPGHRGGTTPGDWRNRAITDVFEPGSIFKPCVMLAAVEEGLFRMPNLSAPIPKNPLEPIPGEDIIDCENGAWRIRSQDGRTSRTLHDAHPYGKLPLSAVMIKSSNIGMAKVGRALGFGRLSRYIDAFGFGHKLGIDLPGEAAGFMPPTENYPEVFTVPSVTMGHSIGVTALQVLTSFNQIANGGYILRPVVVAKATDANGQIIHLARVPDVLGHPMKNEAAREWMRKTLIRVCAPGGTATLANLDAYGITVAGKTGTAEKVVGGRYSSEHKVCSFLAFAPAENPVVSVLVIVDEPTVHVEGRAFYGGSVAGPAVRNIILRALRQNGMCK